MSESRDENWAREVAAFWLGLDEAQWWQPDAALDETIRERFLDLWEEQKARPAADFLGDAETALGAVILFDQFPRNMFRDDARAYATDHLALAITKGALDRDYHEEMERDARLFLLMPFQHSEDLADQRRSLLEFTALGDDKILEFARLHHDVIARFGRFPHRNAVLGRKPRADEIAAGDAVKPW